MSFTFVFNSSSIVYILLIPSSLASSIRYPSHEDMSSSDADATAFSTVDFGMFV